MAEEKRRRIDDDLASEPQSSNVTMLLSVLSKEALIEIITENIENEGLMHSILNKADNYDDCKNLFIRKIPLSATSDDLYAIFSPFGKLSDCMIVTDKVTKQSKGYGFIKYDKAESALKAVEAKLTIDGNEIAQNYACMYSKASRNSTQVSQQYSPINSYPGSISSAMVKTPNHGDVKKLYLRNLPWDVPDSTLRDYFTSYGPITDFHVCRDHNTHKSKGYGFLTFATDMATLACLNAPSKMFQGREILVTIANQPVDEANRQSMPTIFPGKIIDPNAVNLTATAMPQQLYSMPMWGMSTVNPNVMGRAPVMSYPMGMNSTNINISKDRM